MSFWENHICFEWYVELMGGIDSMWIQHSSSYGLTKLPHQINNKLSDDQRLILRC